MASLDVEFAEADVEGMAQRPTVAVLSSTSFCIFNYRESLIRALLAQGYRVLALAPHDEAGRERLRRAGAEPIDIRLDQTGKNPLRDLRDMLALARTLRRLRPDIIMPSFTKPVIWGSIAARLAGVPRILPMVSGLGYVFTGSEGFKRRTLQAITATLYRLALSGAERVFFENSDDIAEFAGSGSVSRYKAVRLDGAGVDTNHFAPAPLGTEPRFLFVGRMLREKGIAELIEAFRAVRAKEPCASLILLGGTDPNPGSYSADDLRTLARNGVTWIDKVEDVRPWIAVSNVFVLPSYREGLPRSTLEAMSMGRPIVTTDAVGCRETVRDNGFMVPVGDTDALADAMLRFVAEPDLIASMGAASRRYAEQRFSSERVNAAVLRVLRHSHLKRIPEKETQLAPLAP